MTAIARLRLAYAIATGLLVGVYAGLVILATQVLSFSSPVAVDRTIAAFAGRLQDATDVGAVRADVMTTARTVLEPAHASVWLAGSGR